MMGTSPGVRPATEHDHEAAAEALALAFADDPAWAHLLPDAATRAERLLVFFTAEIDNLIPEHRRNLRDARRGANDPRDVARPDLGLFLAGLEPGPGQCQVSARLATSSRPSPLRRDE